MDTTTKPDLAALLERVRNAMGAPDGALGFDLAKALESKGHRRTAQCNAAIEGSLDAALFFFRENLRGWGCEITIDPDGSANCDTFDWPRAVAEKDFVRRYSDGAAATPALAVIAALLSALIAKGEG